MPEAQLIYHDEESNFSIFLGSYFAAKSKKFLLDNKITHVLNVADEIPNEHEGKPDCAHITYCKLDLDDTVDFPIEEFLPSAHSFIDSSRNTASSSSILIHCKAGMSRSAAIVISYLMKQYQFSLHKAMYHSIEKRPEVSPNKGFIKKLQVYEKSLFNQQETTLDWRSYWVSYFKKYFKHCTNEYIAHVLADNNDDPDLARKTRFWEKIPTVTLQ